MNTDWLLYVLGVLSYLILIAAYVFTRKRGGWALDSFLLLFSIQYGPHTLWITGFHRVADLVSPGDTERFLVGMSIAYLCVAIGLVAASGVSFEWAAQRSFPVQGNSDVILVIISLLYVLPFIAAQGLTLPVTSEYLRAFSGSSFFDYDELRREMFAGSTYERLASITRQTTTAILFSYIIRRCLQHPMSLLVLLPCAATVFLLCSLQMNKFPFVYYFMLIILTYLSVAGIRSLKDGLFKLFLLFLGAVGAVAILIVLYRFQYNRATNEVMEVLIYRIFYCSSDTLRLWYDYFPAKEEFLNLRGVPLTARLSGQTYVNPTVVVPESLLTGRITSFQVGFMGSGYACYGFVGVAVYSIVAGVIASVMASIQHAFHHDPGAKSFLAVLTLNVFFLTTRELHTAMLSGGTVSVILLFFAFRFLHPARFRLRRRV